MADIKRYLIDQSLSDEIEEITGDFEIFDELWCKSEDVDKLISDHKAVVETKDNRILELEKMVESLKCCGDGDGCKGNQVAKGIK